MSSGSSYEVVVVNPPGLRHRADPHLKPFNHLPTFPYLLRYQSPPFAVSTWYIYTAYLILRRLYLSVSRTHIGKFRLPHPQVTNYAKSHHKSFFWLAEKKFRIGWSSLFRIKGSLPAAGGGKNHSEHSSIQIWHKENKSFYPEYGTSYRLLHLRPPETASETISAALSTFLSSVFTPHHSG